MGYGGFQNVKIAERQTVQLRAEAFNIFNPPSFYVGSESSSATRFTVNNTTFGKITGVFMDARRLQLGLYYRF